MATSGYAPPGGGARERANAHSIQQHHGRDTTATTGKGEHGGFLFANNETVPVATRHLAQAKCVVCGIDTRGCRRRAITILWHTYSIPQLSRSRDGSAPSKFSSPPTTCTEYAPAEVGAYEAELGGVLHARAGEPRQLRLVGSSERQQRYQGVKVDLLSNIRRGVCVRRLMDSKHDESNPKRLAINRSAKTAPARTTKRKKKKKTSRRQQAARQAQKHVHMPKDRSGPFFFLFASTSDPRHHMLLCRFGVREVAPFDVM